MFEPGSTPRGRPESVQVRARIIRDPAQPLFKMSEAKADPIYSSLELKQSPLVVDHHRGPVSGSFGPSEAPSTAPDPTRNPTRIGGYLSCRDGGPRAGDLSQRIEPATWSTTSP